MSLWVLDLILPFRDLFRNSPLNIHGLSQFQGAQAIAASTPAHLSYQDTRWMTLCPVLPGGRVKSGLGFRVWGLGFRVRVDHPSLPYPRKSLDVPRRTRTNTRNLETFPCKYFLAMSGWHLGEILCSRVIAKGSLFPQEYLSVFGDTGQQHNAAHQEMQQELRAKDTELEHARSELQRVQQQLKEEHTTSQILHGAFLNKFAVKERNLPIIP